MIERIIISEKEFYPYYKGKEISEQTKALLQQQMNSWELLRNGYKSLDLVKVKHFEFEDFTIKVQFNPGRIISSSAKVDAKSISERKCFLCFNNLPADQKGILYKDEYLILCNPFPIFHEHFTLPNIEHLPQLIEDSFLRFLEFSRDLGKYYTVFYNGPKCGASAPDHLHFQAGEKYFMPIDKEYDEIKYELGSILYEDENLKVLSVDKYLRRMISFESSSSDILLKAFDIFYSIFSRIKSDSEEPMMNILSSYENGTWKIFIFPREKHRPSQYFEEGDNNILLSPAAVDLGGVMITPLEKDFDKITKDNIIDIFKQITVSTEYFEFLKLSLKEELSGIFAKSN